MTLTMVVRSVVMLMLVVEKVIVLTTFEGTTVLMEVIVRVAKMVVVAPEIVDVTIGLTMMIFLTYCIRMDRTPV